jgi:PAS domain S-box-containing protein
MADQLQQTLTDLQEGEERIRGLIAAAFDGFAIHQEGRILEASPQFAALFGYAPAELIGRSVLDFIARNGARLCSGIWPPASKR